MPEKSDRPNTPGTAPLAAQVVIAKPGQAKSATAAESLRQRPAPEVAERAVRAFEALGFVTGPVVGDSFSIEAAPGVFEAVFGAIPTTTRASDSGLPMARLPASLREVVQDVVLSAPPDFGPGVMP